MILRIIKAIFRSKFMALVVLGLGVFVSYKLIKTGPKPQKRQYHEKEQQVEAIKVTPMTIVPKAKGYGQAKPERDWDAVAQVSGKVIFKNKKLKSGEFFKKDDVLLKIDANIYKLNIRKAEAEIKKYQAKLQELELTRDNLEKQLSLHKQTLSVNEKNLNRQKKLYKSNVVAQSVVEEEEISVLQQQNNLESIQSTFNLIPAQIDYQKAALAAAEAALEQSKLDLEYTTIKAPFNCIVDNVSVEEQQFVSEGQTMLELDATDKAEVTAQFSIDQLSMLVGEPAKDVTDKIQEKQKPDPVKFPALVKSFSSTVPFSWPAKFERFASGIDSITRMVSIVVSVERPYKRNRQKFQPPLVKGLFCQVEITGRQQDNMLVVPRKAIHNNMVYVADKDSRLVFRKVTVSYNYGQFAVIKSGLKAGETLITTDLLPAVEGMKLKVIIDPDYIKNAEKKLATSGKKV